MNLVRFNQIKSAYHLESGKNKTQSADKCYQLQYAIQRFSDRSGNIFDIGTKAAFDEGGMAIRSRYCPVRQYNKSKPDILCKGFFYLPTPNIISFITSTYIMDQTQFFFDIHESFQNILIKQKAVENAIFKSGIENDPNGCRYLFIDNIYSAPHFV